VTIDNPVRACAVTQKRPTPAARSRQAPAAGVSTVTIRPQFRTVMSVRLSVAASMLPEGSITVKSEPDVSTVIENVTRRTVESTGTTNSGGESDVNVPIAHSNVSSRLPDDSRTK